MDEIILPSILEECAKIINGIEDKEDIRDFAVYLISDKVFSKDGYFIQILYSVEKVDNIDNDFKTYNLEEIKQMLISMLTVEGDIECIMRETYKRLLLLKINH